MSVLKAEVPRYRGFESHLILNKRKSSIVYLNIVGLPWFGFLSSSSLGNFLGGRGASWITTVCMGGSMLLSLLCFYEVGMGGSPLVVQVVSWVHTDLFHANWCVAFDSLSCLMVVLVSFVSFLVHLYSTEYMESDPHLSRFMAYLSLFTFFMIILITGDNFLQMFVGWEGVGLCSYLLINFWYTRIQANKAAIKAMVLNRIGDLGLGLGIFAIFLYFQTMEYTSFFASVPYQWEETSLFLGFSVQKTNLIGVLLFIGAMGKSAQLGLHTWLPDAMEGPTPVSALIHAATMVTAGVFLLSRCSGLLEYAPQALSMISFVGASTSFFAATTALVQNDMKRVIAYSTCSQLGYMIFACGLSNYGVGVFHLVNHGFFKALLFLGAGSVIHGISNEQDMRKMGGLRRLLPFTYAMMLIGSLSLMGFPYLTGFYSKDVILEVAYAKCDAQGYFAYVLGCGAAFCTAFYSMRLLFLTFLAEPMGSKVVLMGAHEPGWKMSLPLGVLAIPSLFLGFVAKDCVIGIGSDFFGNALFYLPQNYSVIDGEFLPTLPKLFPVILSLTGFSLSFYLYAYCSPMLYKQKMENISAYIFLNRKWFFDKLYNQSLSQVGMKLAYKLTYKDLDRGLFQILGPKGVGQFAQHLSTQLQRNQSGLVYHAGLLILGGCVWGFFLPMWGWEGILGGILSILNLSSGPRKPSS